MNPLLQKTWYHLQKLSGLDPKDPDEAQAQTTAKLPSADRAVLGVDQAVTLDKYLKVKAIAAFRVHDGPEVGAMVIDIPNKPLRFVFGVVVEGVHSFMTGDELESFWDSLIATTRTLPEGERLGIRLSSFKSASERVLLLTEQIRRCKNSAIRTLLMAELSRVESLAAAGLREPKILQFFPTFSGPQLGESPTVADKVVANATGFLESLYRRYKRTKKVRKKEELTRTFLEAYTLGYQSWRDLFTQTLGVDIRPMSAAQIYEFLWSRFNKSQPQEIPYLIRFTHDLYGSRFEQQGDRKYHLTRYLLHDCSPRFDPKFVVLEHYNEHSQRVEKDYIGVLRFSDKIQSWENGHHQMRWAWNLLSCDRVTDTELYIEIAATDKTKAAKQALSVYQQAMLKVRDNNRKTRYSGRADDEIQEAKKLLLGLSRGDTPCDIGAVILIHRRDVNELAQACADMTMGLRPNKVEREVDCAHRLFTQTTFCEVYPLGRVQWIGDMRQRYQAHEVPGLWPLLGTQSVDTTGLEFIARDGGTPYFLDLFSQGKEKHLGIIAAHRSGKSEAAIALVTEALSLDVPVTVMDYPTGDGDSSFADYTRYVGGSYLDIGEESINLIEVADLSALPPAVQKRRFKAFKTFCAVQIMAFLDPNPEDYQLKQDVQDVVDLALRVYFDDGLIQQRYEKAIRDGFGSEAWADTPTLFDFQEFCIRERLPIRSIERKGSDYDRAIEFVQRRFTARLNSPIGQTIARPSTVRTDSQLTVFALTDLSDKDSAIFSLAAFSVASRRSLESPRSMVLFDESQQLAGYNAICELAKTFVTTGGKQGMRACFITNDFDALVQSKAGASILATLNVKLIGKLEHSEAQKISAAFGIPPELAKFTAGKKFVLDKQRLASSWLISEQGQVTAVRRYTPPRALSLAASNNWERRVRGWYFQRYGMHEGLRRFSEIHIPALANGEVLDVPETQLEVVA